jgi:glycosyltransferase involved in cell wall biosynthesis
VLFAEALTRGYVQRRAWLLHWSVLRILTFTSLFPNATAPADGIFVYQRVSHLADIPGNEVRVVAPVPYFPSWFRWSRWRNFGQVPTKEQIGNLKVYHPRYLLIPRLAMPLHGILMFLGCLLPARRLHRQFEFDCIDAHYVYPDGFAAMLLARCLRLPLIVSGRGTDITLFPSFCLIYPMIRSVLQYAIGTIGVCSALRDAMIRLGAPADKSEAIGNGIDLKRFTCVERGAARQQLGMPQNSRILVSVGALRPVKGQDRLILAVAELAPKYPDLILYIVGKGTFGAELQALIQRLALQNRVKLVGARPNDELKFWYSAADVSCLTSSREGWANVLLESLACGTPVVATRVWGTPEVITSTELGVLVDQSVDSIAAGIDLALAKNWNRANLIEHAAGRSWDVVAREVQNFFERVLYHSH